MHTTKKFLVWVAVFGGVAVATCSGGSIVGVVRAVPPKVAGEAAAGGGAYDSRRYKFVEKIDYDRLRALPETTFGGAYARHLDNNGITADYQAAATRHVDDPDIAYLMRRFRQTHDVWHALLGLGITGHEEVIIHWFSYGQLRLPVSAMIMMLGTMKHIVLEKRWGAFRHSMFDAYRAGRDASPLMPVYWEDLWEAPLETVRVAYNLEPLERRWLD